MTQRGIPTFKIKVNGVAGPPLAGAIYVGFGPFDAIQGTFFATKPLVSPDLIEDAPARQSSIGGTVTLTRMFQCVQAGTASIAHDAYIAFNQTVGTFTLPAGAPINYLPPTLTPEKYGLTKLVYTITTSVDCVTATPTPTASPVPTPTPTPPSTPTDKPTITPSPTPTPIPVPLPVVKKFVALFIEPEKSTQYTVTVSDPNGGVLTYAWSRTNKCGLFGPTNAATVVWHHPDEPGGCPVEPVHPGTIIVVVSNAGGSVTCEYHDGSKSGNVAMCVNSK